MTGDGAIHAVWAASNPPASAMFASTSPDRGQTWSAPQRLGANPVMRVLDVTTTLDVTHGGQTRPGITVQVAMLDAPVAGIYALTSLNGGLSWGEPEAVAVPGSAQTMPMAAPAYEPAAQQLLAFWTCCADGLWGNAEATHYVSRRALSDAAWTPVFADRVPLVSGGYAVGRFAVAQARNAPVAWLAWVENGTEVRARTLDLANVIPAWVYPTPTATPDGA